MPASPPPSPAYVATIRPLPLNHPALRRVRLSERQVAALDGLTAVPIVIDGTSRLTPCAQAETALQDVTRDLLGREVCVVLYRWSNGGELWVLCGGGLVQVANIDLTPARVAERAVA